MAAQKTTGTECLCLPRQTAQMGRVLFWKAEASCAPMFGKGGADWESTRKERGRLGRDPSACPPDGGEMGRLERLGVRECAALVNVLDAGA